MSGMIEELEQALALHRRGRSEEAVEIARRLLTRARGTPHAARVFRTMSEFLLAIGNYADARELAREARSLAQATRHPGEILGSSLALLTCDLYQGEVGMVYQVLEELRVQAEDHPRLRTFTGWVMLTIGELDQAVEHMQETRTLLVEGSPDDDLLLARLLCMEGKAHLLADRPGESLGLFDRVLQMDLSTLVPQCLARAMLGQATARLGDWEQGIERVDQAAQLARKISRDVHGRALALSGLTRLNLGETGSATEQLRAAVALMTHALERQESFHALGHIADQIGQDAEAIRAYRRATEPTSETHFGRLAVRRLKELVGFRVI
jgi:tetratricopeptide (TPR) repeat protein